MTLPSRFRRATLLIIGCGDVGLRVARLVRSRMRVVALTHSPGQVPLLRAAGIVPLQGDLDDAASLRRLAGLAPRVLHLAPPPGLGEDDPRTRALVQALSRHGAPARLVYGSTSGVYGDAGGHWVDETWPRAATTARAQRRVAAENTLRDWALRSGTSVTTLRIPGIYAFDREGGDPRERVRAGTPVLRPEDDVYTNHIHADDLARACWLALFRGRPQRAVNVCDDTDRKAGEQAEHVADLCGLPPPPRLSREEAQRTLSPLRMSFLSESRRLRNARMKRELRLRLRWPTVDQALRQVLANQAAG